MCGIFGVVSHTLPENIVIKKALDSIRHRGPDDEGYLFADISDNTVMTAGGADTFSAPGGEFRKVQDVGTEKYQLVLGNRRLSVIDLSPRGHQPMSYDDDNLWITYNGEIFNYGEIRYELRARGHVFRSDTDTEVILAAYKQWGEQCVSRFNGQWAFCIYDRRSRRLFCSRDRFGIKPFYYWFDGKTFAFASEMKALLTLPFVGRQINKALLFELIFFHMHHHKEQSLYAGINQLLQSHNLIVDLKEFKTYIYRYYELTCNEDVGRYVHHRALGYADDIRDLLTDSVKLRLISDVPVGSCLSGGLDSSSIVVIISKLLKEGGIIADRIGERQKTFTASFDDPSVDETIYANTVVSHTGVEAFFTRPSAEALWKELDTFLLSQDGICKSTNVYAGWSVMRLASEQVKVVLNGQGSDELFGGYPRYEQVYCADMIRNVRIRELIVYFRKKTAMYGLRKCLERMMMGSFIAGAPNELQRGLFRLRNRHLLRAAGELLDCPAHGTDAYVRMTDKMRSLNYSLYSDVTCDYLAQLLHEDDGNAAGSSIENRVPFVDHRLVEYVSGIPSVYKLHDGWSKWLLRLAMRDLLPEKILWRKDKIGFLTPVDTWIRHRNSPVPRCMERFGIKDGDSYFAWKFYLAAKLIEAVEAEVPAGN